MLRKLTSYISISAMVFSLVLALGLSYQSLASEEGGFTIESALDTSELFTERDLEQSPDLEEAISLSVSDGDTLSITKAGTYLISGSARDCTILVEAGDEDKVQLVLDNVSLTNEDMPCIAVENGDKVFITLQGENTLTVSSDFNSETDYNAAIFSRSDLVLNGTGSLAISSPKNGISGKDDLKITGGTYQISASKKAIDANDSIRIARGSFTLKAGTDALHAENSDDDTLGYIYISDGTFSLEAGDDAIHGTSVVQIDGGSFEISAGEGIEGTYIQLNDGDIYISASDDGINAAQKSDSYMPTLEINGGTLTVVMDSGDTDGLDSNGNLIINGGYIDVTANSAVDYDGTGQYRGGTLIINGQEVTSLPNQMMGGGFGGQGFGGRGGHGGRGGQW